MAPGVTFDEARKHLPAVLDKRGKPAHAIEAALARLEALGRITMAVPVEAFGSELAAGRGETCLGTAVKRF